MRLINHAFYYLFRLTVNLLLYPSFFLLLDFWPNFMTLPNATPHNQAKHIVGGRQPIFGLKHLSFFLFSVFVMDVFKTSIWRIFCRICNRSTTPASRFFWKVLFGCMCATQCLLLLLLLLLLLRVVYYLSFQFGRVVRYHNVLFKSRLVQTWRASGF